MKKTKKLFATILVSGFGMSCLMFTSCKKGETGPAGPAGPAGTNGTNGTNGVANIQTSSVTSTNGSWSYDATEDSYNATISYPAITQAVVDRGTVQVQIGNSSGTSWVALPFAYFDLQYSYEYRVGQVVISVVLNNSTPLANPGGQVFKIVVIPPASKSSEPISSENNERVEQIFKIKG